MLILESLIQSLEASHAKAFLVFLKSGGGPQPVKEEQLFHILRKSPELPSDEISRQLYGSANRNAYHTLRKRLQRKLYHFLQFRTSDDVGEPYLDASLAIGAATQLIRTDRAEVAAKLLQKSRALARKANDYEGSLAILRHEIRHADVLGLDYLPMLDEWKELHNLVSIMQRVDVAYSLLRLKLREVRVTGQLRSLDALVRVELDSLGIDLDQDLPADVVYRMMEIIRMAIIATKEYHQFDPLITQTHRHLVESGKLGENETALHTGFAYMIAHTKFRARKLDEALLWTEKLNALLQQDRANTSRHYIARYYLLRAAILNFSGRNTEAISILEHALERPEPVTADRMNMLLNLCVYLFQVDELKRARQVLQSIDTQERKLERLMGREWLFKKSMIEMILLVEANHTELIFHRLRSVKRLYKELLNDPINDWMGTFISAIELMLKDPLQQNNAKVLKQLDSMLNHWPVNREDLHAMTFRCWLKSRVEGTAYYQELIHTYGTQWVADSSPRVAL